MDDQSASCMESRSEGLPGLHLFQGVCQFKEDAADSSALVRSSFIQQVCRRGFSGFVKNIMALSSVGLYSAIQMHVKAATVQQPRSTSQLERSVLINAENEASKCTETPENMQVFFFLFVPLTNAQNLSPRSHEWIVILVDSTEM